MSTYPDGSKPNHYFDDSLGDPATCTGDHNHPEPETDDPQFSGLPASVVDTAKKAHCTRCKEQIVTSPGMTGTLMFQYYVPALGVRQRGILCGPCGLAFREFAYPDITSNPLYRAVVAELRKQW